MKPYVDIEGSGQEATVIQGNGVATPDDGGVVRGAASAELREPQIKSTAASFSSAIAFFSASGDTRLRNVTLVASGTAGAWGIRAPGGSPVVEECTIRAQGSSSSYGFVSLTATSRPTIKRTVIEVTSGSLEGRGMAFLGGSVPMEIRDVQVKVSGSSSNAYGIYLLDNTFQNSTRITSATIDVSGASNNKGILFKGLPRRATSLRKHNMSTLLRGVRCRAEPGACLTNAHQHCVRAALRWMRATRELRRRRRCAPSHADCADRRNDSLAPLRQPRRTSAAS
jgi:hypothetical protein